MLYCLHWRVSRSGGRCFRSRKLLALDHLSFPFLSFPFFGYCFSYLLVSIFASFNHVFPYPHSGWWKIRWLKNYLCRVCTWLPLARAVTEKVRRVRTIDAWAVVELVVCACVSGASWVAQCLELEASGGRCVGSLAASMPRTLL